MKKWCAGILATAALPAFPLMANEGEGLNFYGTLAHWIGLDPACSALLGSLLVFLLTVFIALVFNKEAQKRLETSDLAPKIKVNLFFFIESVAAFLTDLAKEQCGHYYKSYLPLLSGLFFFILFANLSGLVPGFPPPTENFSANLAMGGIVFLAYNFAGIKEHGASYIKQFMGPFLVLAPLFLVLEFISHAVRPLSLSFRLLANIFADHLVLSVFSSIVPILFPTVLLFFGLLVACIQSFVFTMLTSIYISMAISHDH